MAVAEALQANAAVWERVLVVLEELLSRQPPPRPRPKTNAERQAEHRAKLKGEAGGVTPGNVPSLRAGHGTSLRPTGVTNRNWEPLSVEPCPRETGESGPSAGVTNSNVTLVTDSPLFPLSRALSSFSSKEEENCKSLKANRETAEPFLGTRARARANLTVVDRLAKLWGKTCYEHRVASTTLDFNDLRALIFKKCGGSEAKAGALIQQYIATCATAGAAPNVGRLLKLPSPAKPEWEKRGITEAEYRAEVERWAAHQVDEEDRAAYVEQRMARERPASGGRT